MLRTASDRRLAAATLCALGLAFAAPFTTQAQEREGARRGSSIVGSEISISRGQAELKLELANGRKLTLSTVAGNAQGVLNSGTSGSADNLSQVLSLGVSRGDALDRSWRDLLNEAMDTPSDGLAELLSEWEAPEGGAALDNLLENALLGRELMNLPNAPDAPAGPDAPQFGDSLHKLQEKILQLEHELESREHGPMSADEFDFDERRRGWTSPLRHVGRGIAGIISILVTLAVLFGLGFALVFFGGRKYLEGVADAARHATGRSFLVGLAASFLVVPAFVLGAIVLAISIVGIPALIVWIPAFPLAVVLGTILGYLGVAHATGEAMAERRFYGGDWFSRANSYYYLMTGLGLLLAFFLAAQIIEIAGPWLSFIEGILLFLGVVLTWAAATTGFGAVLITRAGSRPLRSGSATGSEAYAETSSV